MVPNPPDGYSKVTTGKIRKDDLVWNAEDKKWEHPKKVDYETLGTEVTFYYGVCRKPEGLGRTRLS